MNTETTLVDAITGSRDLFAWLLPVAVGVPVGPDGDVFEYGDEQLAEWVIQTVSGETVNWPSDLNRRISMNSTLWAKLRTLTEDEVLSLDDEGWARVRNGLLTAHPDRMVPCMYCATLVAASESAIHQHYRDDMCWNDES